MASPPKIVLHWLENSRAQRILWLLEELELPYEVIQYKRDPKTKLAPKELKAIHPLGKSPVVTYQEGEGAVITLAESGAIVEFLVEHCCGGKLGISPTGDAQERATYLYWTHWAEGTAMTPLMMSIVFSQMPKQSPFFIRPLVRGIADAVMASYIRPKLKDHYAFVEAHLSDKEFFVGATLTGADIMMVFIAEALEPALGYTDYPHTKAWLDRVSARPAYKLAEEKGGKTDVGYFTR